MAVSYRYGGKRGKKLSLKESNDMVVVRTKSRSPLSRSPLSQDARQALGATESVVNFEDAGVEVVRCVAAKSKAVRDKVRQSLKSEGDIRFAGRVLSDPQSGAPIIYTENFFVKFNNNVAPSKCKRLIKAHGLVIKKELSYARNAYFVAAPDNIGQEVFNIAEKLLADEAVELCHPELVRELRHRQAFAQQWHLKKTTINGQTVDEHASVEAAWPLSQGEGITIAIIDDGVDTSHKEFAGSGKVVFPRDVTQGLNSAWPGSSDNHGTACAGVACANGNHGASGVAPKANLMPIRHASSLGSQAEADAFVWAADHGADVISCSWGPADGTWWQPSDPQHNAVVALPDSTRLAINYAINKGRNGKGCVITWAAGNGNESVDNDHYASYDKVIAVAACNDRGTKSVYSDYGNANWCAFPSSDFGPTVKTPGIWTTDRSGTPGYSTGDYANDFGGTSSACPGAAGVAALVLARNPELRWDEAKDILKRCCDKIDQAGGNYNANGRSPIYGYGRLNAKSAVDLALPPQSAYTTIHTARQEKEIKDKTTIDLSVAVGDTSPIKSVKISVDILHTYIGDLVIKIHPPSSTGIEPIQLHGGGEGGDSDNLQKTYDGVSTPGLTTLIGKTPQGSWKLSVRDTAQQDEGKLLGFSVELGL